MFRKLIALWVFLGCALVCRAQQDHFIYFQSDNKLPFYVRVGGGQDQTSSSSGYLILPRVPSGTIGVAIGFPDQSYPEQHFTIAVPGDKDKGYLVKRFEDRGWALYDLQDLTLTFADTAATQAKSSAVASDSSSVASVPPAVAKDTTAVRNAVVVTDTTAKHGVVAGSDTVTKRDVLAESDTAAKPVVQKTQPPATDGDAFSNMLVAVTRDPTLTAIHSAPRLAPAPVVAPDTPTGARPEAPEAGARETAAKKKYYSRVRLLSSDTTAEGIRMVFVDHVSGRRTDTIRLFLPGAPLGPEAGADTTQPTADSREQAPDTVVHAVASTVNAAAPSGGGIPAGDTTTVGPIPPIPDTPTTAAQTAPVQGAPRTDTPAKPTFDPSALIKAGRRDTATYVVPVFKSGGSTDSSGSGTAPAPGNSAPAAGTVAADTPAAAPGARGLVIANTDCKRVAGDEDFMRLRKKMASEPEPDRMIDVARKAFKKSCFTTEQVRNLSYLFLQPEGKYRFLEEAYPYVSDTGNFKTLESLFTDPYYINRFRALVQR